MITFDEVISGKANRIWCPLPNASGQLIPTDLKQVRPVLLRSNDTGYTEQVWLWSKSGFDADRLTAKSAVAMVACYPRWDMLFLMSPHPLFTQIAMDSLPLQSKIPSIAWSNYTYRLDYDYGTFASTAINPLVLLWEIVGKKWAFHTREELVAALGGAERYDWKEKVWKKAKEIGYYHPGHPDRITNARRGAYREKVFSITI